MGDSLRGDRPKKAEVVVWQCIGIYMYFKRGSGPSLPALHPVCAENAQFPKTD